MKGGPIGIRLKIAAALVAAYAGFSFLPDTLWNWAYDYFQFIPWWGTVLCVLAAVGVLFLPSDIWGTKKVRIPLLTVLILLLPVCFVLFRTRIHCFGGDGCVGSVPVDLTVSWRDFVPPLPTVGRLDLYGHGLVTKLSIRSGLLAYFPGMATMAASQVYAFIWGAVYVTLACVFLRKRLDMLFMVLTPVWVFNFFGNVDCYPLPLCVALMFFVYACHVLSRERVLFTHVAGLTAFWLFCGWAHPLAGVAGFLPAVAAARWFDSLRFRFKVGEKTLCIAYGILFFVIIEIGYGKPVFAAVPGEVPPVFSTATFVHMLNVCVLPALPIILFVFLGKAELRLKTNCLVIFLLQLACFAASHFTQGVNDQFPHSLYTVGVVMPWLVAAWKSPLEARSVKGVVALNLLVFLPLVWVHSSDLTVARALTLYPLDTCKHNVQMSWQTHLGLVLGDNLIDSETVKKATLRTFENGSRHARPEIFRGGNHLYHTAFLYHFGEFEKGGRQLRELLKRNPRVVQYFLDVRPGFAYMNRQRLWDDLYAFSSAQVQAQLKPVLDKLRERARAERYCLDNPAFMRCEY